MHILNRAGNKEELQERIRNYLKIPSEDFESPQRGNQTENENIVVNSPSPHLTPKGRRKNPLQVLQDEENDGDVSEAKDSDLEEIMLPVIALII